MARIINPIVRNRVITDNPLIATTTAEMVGYLSASFLNSFVKYTGTTNASYTKNHFYQVDSNGQEYIFKEKITPNGTQYIVSNGTHDVKEYANANVSIPQGEPIEISTAAGMDALLVAANVGKAYKFTGTTDSTYTNGDIYIVEDGV